MKNHIAVKFIAIALCALSLLGAAGGIAGIVGLSEMGLYNMTVEEYRTQQLTADTMVYANNLAFSYAGKILGGCSDDMVRAQIGDFDWFVRQYPNHGYKIVDAEGKVLSSYNLEAAEYQKWQAFTHPVSGKYMHLVEAQEGQAAQQLIIERTVAPGEEYLYDAIQPMGSYVTTICVGYSNESNGYGSDVNIGILLKDESGRVLFRGFEPCMEITDNEPYYFKCMDAMGETIYEISSSAPVGLLTTDENGYLVFCGNEPVMPAAETVPETTMEATTEETESSEETEETETEETSETEQTHSDGSAVPEETQTEENMDETVAGGTEETVSVETIAVEPTVAETAVSVTVPAETVPDVAVTEPVMIDDKPLSSYQINRIKYYDGQLHENVTAQYVYVTMPEMTVTLYVNDDSGAQASQWELVRIIQNLRHLLLPMGGLCLLVFAGTAVYLCNAAGRRPGVPEVRAGGLNRIPLDLYLVGGGCLIAFSIAGAAATFQYLVQNDVLSAFCIGVLLCYLGCLVFVGFCYAFVAQIKSPYGYWWRNTLCCRALELCIRFAIWLERIFSTKTLPWLIRVTKKLWRSICIGAGWLEKRVNRFISYLPMVWQWLLAGGVCVLLVFASDGSFWSLLLWVLLICYGAYCFGKLMDSATRMSKGDLDIQVDDKHMVGAFSQFAQSLNKLSDVSMSAARKHLKSERMKTELITNVSHDIKTPLTSIINYVDLLQKAETEEERQEYLEVLDRQSLRLKKLIEDLMDMSKASTGNMTVDITRVDAVEAVNQALGEFADKLDRAMLVPMFRHDEPSVPMMADGRLVWRVLSNLLGNAVKYALPGTRLYIDLSRMGGKVILSVKNISREELNIDSEELMERFVRGDDSRNTEGSGLGLNIARSLMELQKGELQLLVDGDLFKVTLIFPGI